VRALLALLLLLLLAVPAHAQFAMPDQRARSGQIVTATKPQTLTNKTFGSGVVVTLLPLTPGSTIAVPAGVNPPSSNVFSVTLAANSTLANPTNLVPGQILQFNVAQPASGGPYTLGFGTEYYNFAGAAFTVTLNAAASSVTVFQCATISTSVLQCGQPQGTLTLGSTALALGSTTTNVAGLTLTTFGSATNCSSSASPAVCASAAAGSVALPTGTNPTLVVNTSAVTANSQILLAVDESLGTKLGVTCNTTLSTLLNPVVTARTAATSFTFTIGAIIATNPACVSYAVIN